MLKKTGVNQKLKSHNSAMPWFDKISSWKRNHFIEKWILLLIIMLKITNEWNDITLKQLSNATFSKCIFQAYIV